MEVTRKNFKESLDVVSESIERASFIAIDAEFTGLSLPGSMIHAFETPEERYKKLKEVVTRFLAMQFGVATFQYSPETDRYSSKVYNFYVFPRPFAKQAPDPRFSCQSSSIDFLASQGFDFNKLFRDGIPYLCHSDEEQLRASLQEKHSTLDARNAAQKQQLGVPQFSSPAFSSPSGDLGVPYKGPCAVPEEHQEYIENISTTIENFLKSEDKELPLAPCNGFLRKLIYQTVAQRFPSGIHLESKTDDKRMRYILISKALGEEEMREKERAKRQAEFQEIEDAVGFSKIIRLIAKSGKLVIGHNMMLDLLFVLNQFCCPLPEDYEDFKNMTRNIFPCLLDTKHMASSGHFKDRIPNTTLGDMQKSLEHSPFARPEVDTPTDCPSYSTKSEHLHEAGYDAYITGLSFISMANFLGTQNDSKSQTILPTSPMVEPYLNKLYMMRMQDIPYINLTGADLSPSRDHVFHVTFCRDWKASDISHLFAPFGNVQIAWVDDTSAFVALYRYTPADVVLRQLSHTENYHVTSYYDYIRKIYMSSMCETPKQFVGEKRKPSPGPVSDLELPRKKRRSSRESPFVLNRSITTIPEEEEATTDALIEAAAESLEDGELASTDSNSCHGAGEGTNGNHVSDPDLSKPSKAKKRKHPDSDDGLFDVPDTW